MLLGILYADTYAEFIRGCRVLLYSQGVFWFTFSDLAFNILRRTTTRRTRQAGFSVTMSNRNYVYQRIMKGAGPIC